MPLYAIVETGGAVSNLIIWDGVTALGLDPSLQFIQLPDGSPVGPGYTYSNGTFTPPAGSSSPTLKEQAVASMYAGLTINSNSTPALNGTYAGDPTTQSKIMAIAQYIVINSRFPASQTTFSWPDASGTLHAFPSTALFLAFATAMGDFIAGVYLVISGVLTSLPSNSTTII